VIQWSGYTPDWDFWIVHSWIVRGKQELKEKESGAQKDVLLIPSPLGRGSPLPWTLGRMPSRRGTGPMPKEVRQDGRGESRVESGLQGPSQVSGPQMKSESLVPPGGE
jgi:hypothetical protein